jgi:hypothetical protein
MFSKTAAKPLGALLREHMHVQGPGCHQEAELKGRLAGYKDALRLARLVKDERFQQLFNEAHQRYLA